MASNIPNRSSNIPPLPSSIDEIPPSSVRRRPLTAEELRDVRSLLGVAKRGADASKPPPPLAGRRAMVPLTSKAFFEGELHPSMERSDDAEGGAKYERIVVNDGGRLVETTRGEAAGFFARQEEQLAAPKKPARDAAPPAQKKSTMKSKKPTRHDTTNDHAPTGPALPLMEIRETCDTSGKIIDSEVVNISTAVERLEDGLKNVADTGEGGTDGKKLGEVLAQTLQEGENGIIQKVGAASDAISEAEEEATNTAKEAQPTRKETITDEAYQAICTRLEELERLEEEDARSKKANAKSAKKLQSGGWSKGFLNSPKKKSGKKKVATKVVKAKQQPGSGGNAAVLPTKDSVQLGSASDGAASLEKASKVSFGDDQVKEIPRIGQSKVPPRPSPGRPVSFAPVDNAEALQPDPYSPATAVPFEETVFRGIVKERIEPSRKDENRPGGKKKLSRFAQQRLQRE